MDAYVQDKFDESKSNPLFNTRKLLDHYLTRYTNLARLQTLTLVELVTVFMTLVTLCIVLVSVFYMCCYDREALYRVLSGVLLLILVIACHFFAYKFI